MNEVEQLIDEEQSDLVVGMIFSELIQEAIDTMDFCSDDFDMGGLCPNCFDVVHSKLADLQEMLDGKETSH